MANVLNAIDLWERVGNDADLLRQLHSIYQKRSNEVMCTIRSACGEADIPVLAKNAHLLRGMLANMAGPQASAIAGELETQARSGQLDGLSERVEALENAVKNFSTALQQFVPQQDS